MEICKSYFFLFLFLFDYFKNIFFNINQTLDPLSDNIKYVEAKDTNWLIHLIFKNGSFAIDSYFFINGVLLCQIFFNSSRDLRIHNVKEISEHFKHYLLMVLYKLLRILLPFVTVIYSLRIAMKHFNENSILNIPSNDHFTCDNVWKNLLFLDIFSPHNERVSQPSDLIPKLLTFNSN